MSDPAVHALVQEEVRRYDEELNRAGFRTVGCGDTLSEWKWCASLRAATQRLT
jgi:hypothetical protein